MPTYVYKCVACGHQFEKTMRLSDHERKNVEVRCPKCQSTKVQQEPAQFSAVTVAKT